MKRRKTTREEFNVYDTLDNLNKRMKSIEAKDFDYLAGMLEVYRNIGVLSKRINELENHLKLLERDTNENKIYRERS